MTDKNGKMKIGRYCDFSGDVNIEVSDSDSGSTTIYLETSNGNTKINFISTFANLLPMSVLILSDTDTTFYECAKKIELFDLKIYEDAIENFDTLYENFDRFGEIEPFRRFMNITSLTDDELASLLKKIYTYSRSNESRICLIIENTESILRRIRAIKTTNGNYMDRNFKNICAYNVTLICNKINKNSISRYPCNESDNAIIMNPDQSDLYNYVEKMGIERIIEPIIVDI